MGRRASVVPLLGWRPAGAAEHAAKGLPLGELWEAVTRYVWNRPGVPRKSAANRRRSGELARALPDHPTPADVVAWMCSLDSQFGPGTVENHRKAVMAVYRYGADLGLSSGNPAALVPARRSQPDPRPIVNIAEVWPLLLDACRDGREAAFLGVMRYAGLRRGEALGLDLDDVVTSGRDWRLNVVRQRPDPNRLGHTPPKSPAACRELPVRAPLRELLAPVLAAGRPTVRVGMGGGDLLTVSLLFPYREQDLKDLIDRLRERAPLSFPAGKKAWHALRDTLAVEMRRQGKTFSEAAEVLGHSSEYVTRTSYMGVHGVAVHPSTLSGLDPPVRRGRAPPGAAQKGGARPVNAGPAPRRSRQSSPTITKENTTCITPSQKRAIQRALPGLSVGPVVAKPRRRP